MANGFKESFEQGGGMQGLKMTTDPDGAYMIWLPSGGSRSPVTGGTLSRGERVHGVVFQGMGEPLANLDRVLAAIDVVTDPCAQAVDGTMPRCWGRCAVSRSSSC